MSDNWVRCIRPDSAASQNTRTDLLSNKSPSGCAWLEISAGDGGKEHSSLGLRSPAECFRHSDDCIVDRAEDWY